MDSAKPILIYQMGKVGSRSVVQALESATDRPIFHIHQLVPDTLDLVARQSERAGDPVPPHIEAGRRVREELIDTERPVDVVTMVREPIARNISAFFQNLSIFARDPDAPIASLIASFLAGYPHNQPGKWFQNEIERNLGIDVYAEPFDPEQGWRVYERGPVRLLLMRCESPDAVKSQAMRGFFGLSDLELKRVNQSSKKNYRERYTEFVKAARFQPDFVDRMLGTRLTTHFYTPDEIAGFRRKWLASESNSVPA
ncbi:MAG TPA: hypothetical protein ENJ00_05760 [Phycisphaerales bacterium]|nr:hypothetical protein [Phycisphaerales bacterium]